MPRDTTTTWPGTSPTASRMAPSWSIPSASVGTSSVPATSPAWTPKAITSRAPGSFRRPCSSTSCCTSIGTTPGVVLHNHPRWGTIWADSHRIPPIYDQTGAMYGGTIAIDSAYQGGVNQTANALEVVEALGDADVALMVNHGVLIIGSDVREAYLRAAVFEWRCRQAWHVEALGSGVPMERRDGKRIRRPDQRCPWRTGISTTGSPPRRAV